MQSYTPLANLKGILLTSEPSMARLILALSSFIWSMTLYAPGSTFSASKMYRFMEAVASEHIWAVAFLVHSVLALYTLLWTNKHRFINYADSIFGALLWTISSSLMVVARFNGGDGLPAVLSANLVVGTFAWWMVARTTRGT